MPTILLTTYECRTGLLPHLCAKCGVPTDSIVRSMALAAVPQFLMNLFLVICPPLFLVMSAVFRRRFAYELPMCPPHRVDREWRNRISSWTYLIVCATYIAAFTVAY